MVEIGKKMPKILAKAIKSGEEFEFNSNDYKGKKLAVYFYPKDLTPGCTTQACNLRDNVSILKEKGIEVIGVSKDSIKSHMKFIDKKELPFVLLSDEDTKIAQDFGVWGQKSFMGKKYMGVSRQTFLIDENQNIVKIIEKPTVSAHSDEVLQGFGFK